MTEPVKINAMDSETIRFDSSYITGREHANIQAIVDELENRFAAGEGSPAPTTPIKEEQPGFWENQAKGALRTTKSMGHGIMRATQGFWDLLDQAATLVSKATGWEKGGVFKHLSEMAEPPEDWTPETLAQKIISGLAAAPVEIATITALPGSAPVTMGYMGAIRGSRHGLKGAALEAAQGAAMGYALEAAGALRAGVRIPAMAALGGAQARAAGGGPEEIAQSAAVMGGLGIMGGGADKAKEFEQRRREILRVKRMEEGQAEFQGQMPVAGYETEILHNQGRDRARYAVVELNDLVPSHLAGEGFKRNEAYPEKTQERRYETDKAEQAKVIKNARTYNPAYTINTDPSMINGPPAVTKEGVVLGGNSRIMSLDEVYRSHPEKAELYRNTLEANAEDFGLTADEISGFSRPVLVRVVDSSVKTPADFQRRVRLYNEPPTQAMEAKTEGVSKARLMSDESFRVLSAGLEEHGGTLRQYMDKPASRDLVTSLLRDGVLDQAEVNRMIASKTGLLTEDGKRMVEQVVRGRVFDDPEVLDQAPAEAIRKLDMSLPALAQVKARGGDWDITPKLSGALKVYSRMKAEGFKSPGDYFAQGRMFGKDTIDPETRALLDALATRKPAELRADFEDLARAARADVPDQETFAFYTPETPGEAFDRIFHPDRQAEQAMAAEEKARYGKKKGSAKNRGIKTGTVQKQGQTRPPYPESPLQKAERIYDGDPEKVSEQMQLFHRNLQLSLFDQLDETPAVSTARGTLAREKVGSGVRTLGLAIRRELADKGRVDLRGQQAKTAEDVAVLAQVFRNPAYETLRIIYTHDGRIVAHEGVSSRMPGFAGAFVEGYEKSIYKMKDRMKRLRADGYYLLHNHPSGDVDPSYQDRALTEEIASNVPGFQGHVIIDSGKYAVLTRDPGTGSVLVNAYDLPGLPTGWQDPLLQPSIPHPLLGREATLPEHVAHLGRQLRNPEGYVTLIYRSKGLVRAIQEVPVRLLMQVDHAHNFIRGRARAFGAQDVVAWGGDTGSRLPKYAEDELIKGGSLLDVVYTEPRQPDTAGPVSVRESVRPAGGMKFGRFESGYPAYRVAEDPMRQYQPLVSEEPGRYGRPEDEIVLIPDRKKDIRWAGNINLAGIKSTEDIDQVLVDTAEKIKPELEKARRGTISHEETAMLADNMGLTVEQLLARREGQAFNGEQALAARNLLVSSAAEVNRMAKIIAAGDARPSEELAFERAIKLHYAIQSQVAGMTAEAGRALNSFRIMAETKAPDLKNLQRTIEIFGGTGSIEEVANRIAELDTPEKINTTVRQMEKATRWDMFLEAWVNGVLSGPQTHATNILSNGLVATWMIPERMFAASFGKLFNSTDAISMREALQQCYGVIEGIKDGIRLAKESYKQDQPILDSLSKIEGMNRNAITSENLELTGPAGRAVDILGTGIRSVGRALTAEDEFFKAVGYRMELRARALRQAQSEGLTGREAASRIQEIIADPPEDIHMAAIDAARYQTFTKQLTGISATVQAAAAKHPALRIIIPFVRTPANIMRFTFERTPIAPFSKSIRADIMEGGARRDLALARMALGSMVMATAGVMAMQGLITGGGPKEKATRAALYRTGWQPYSIKIGDTYYSFTRLEPLGSLLGLAADATEIMGQIHDLDAEKLATACVMSIARNITSKTYVRGLSELFTMMADPGRYGPHYIQRLAGTAVPAGIAQVARIADPSMKEVHSIIQSLQSRVPGWSESLPPRRNLWGKPIVLGGGWGPDIISPIYTSKEHVEPIDRVILDNQISLGMPKEEVYGVPLLPEEYSRFVELAGNELKDPSTGLGCLETLNRMTKSPLFKRMSGGPEGVKARKIKKTVWMFRDMARQEMLREFPELRELATELREAKLKARTGE